MISKKSLGNSEKSQRYFQLFYFEKILERISKSEYNGQIILKGGLFLTSLIGDDDRTTKDMDAILKGIPLNKQRIRKIFNDIFNININDDVSFEIISISDIRLESQYGGYRLNILSKLDNNKTYIIIELTTGDKITPREMKYNYNCIFSDKKIPIMTYNLETVLAEKFQTIVSRGVLNTRLKDFYDIYVLINFKKDDIDNKTLALAITNTFKKRETILDISEFNVLIEELENDKNIKRQWLEYQMKNSYSKNIKYEDTINSVKLIIEILATELYMIKDIGIVI